MPKLMPLPSVPAGAVASLYQPGDIWSHAQVPAPASWTPSGNLCVQVSFALDNWNTGTTQELMAQWTSGGMAWQCMVSGTGSLQFRNCADGSTAGTSHAIGYTTLGSPANGTIVTVRVVRQSNNAGNTTTSFWVSTNYDPIAKTGTWTQKGTTQSTAGATGIFQSSLPIQLGSYQANSVAGANLPAAGKFYWANVYDGTSDAGTLVAAVDNRTPWAGYENTNGKYSGGSGGGLGAGLTTGWTILGPAAKWMWDFPITTLTPIASQSTRFTGHQSNTVYTIPAAAQMLRLRILGGGGGGGSGYRGAAGGVRCGGGGGAGGGYTEWEVPVSVLTSASITQVYVTVGTGGGGGAAVTADTTAGNAGTAGTGSWVATASGSVTAGNVIGNASGGSAGAGGTTSTGTGGTASAGKSLSAAGGNASTTGLLGGNGNTASGGGASGGGAGAGITAADAVSAGGTGGYAPGGFQTASTGGTSAGGAGAAGIAMPFTLQDGSAGGGGGSANTGVPGGSGGTGSTGAGGGGGGAVLNGQNSGAGGAGGDGFVEIIAYF